jgi:CBS domain containing-hemolysin-like protein
MIYSIFEMGDTLVREIMLPRIYITALDVNTPLEQALDMFLQSGHSRVPVYEESIDNILGLLFAKDLLKVWREGGKNDSLRSLLRTAYFVPEAKVVDELLAEMQTRRIHMAIVVDEYGGVAGLVTLEDIVEEIVGEIRDEYDQGEELPYTQVAEGEYIFQGRIDLEDFNELMGSHLPMDEAETLGGFIYDRMGRVPVSGEALLVDDLELIVEQVSKQRIRKVRARKLPRAAESGQDGEHESD